MRILLTVVGLGFAAVTFGVIHYITTYKAPLIKVMNPTYFETSEKLGGKLAERFFVDLRDERDGLIVFGDDEKIVADAQVWQSFIETSKSLGIEFQSVLSIADKQGFQQFIQSSNFKKGRHIIIIPSEDSWRTLIPDKTLTFWTTPYQHMKTDADQPKVLENCDFKNPFVSFECLSERVRFQFYRKRLKEGKFSAMMQQLYDKTFVLYIFEPLT